MTPPKNDELMPEEIWAVKYTSGTAWYRAEKSDFPSAVQRIKYIRADIAAQGDDSAHDKIMQQAEWYEKGFKDGKGAQGEHEGWLSLSAEEETLILVDLSQRKFDFIYAYFRNNGLIIAKQKEKP